MPNKFINNSNIRNGGSPIRYTYNYDTIGRLIGTDQTGGTAELRASYQYDTNNRLTRMSYSIPGVVDNATESFYYNGDGNSVVEDRTNVGEGTLKGMALFSNSWITYSYDDLSRLTQRRVGSILDEHYTYLAGSETGTTTTLPETYYTTLKGSSTKQSGYRYAYDVRNNITRITNLKDNSYIAYACDKLGQMQYATEYAANGTAQKRYKYYYDNAGNLTSWRIEDGTATIIKEEHTYTYGDSNWKDLLTAFDGQSITYDANGNPTKYYNGGTMTWRNGRQLASYSLGGTTYSYEYDVNGLRTRKTNADGGYTEYYIVDGLAVAEQRHYASGAEWYTMRYLYDESNNPIGFGMQYPAETGWQNYYFAKNVQGDIIAIYRYDYDASTQKPYGTLIATYQYDPWGNPRGIKDASGKTIAQTANHVATYNPFRYRGYRYDGDTGLYYLQSRYYDPMTCRFVNADRYASTGQGQLGCNMFAYCNNSPENYSDPTGSRAMGPSYVIVNDGGSSRTGSTSEPSDSGLMPDYSGATGGVDFGLCCAIGVAGAVAEEVDIGSLIGKLGTYNELRAEAAGTGLQVHHLIEKRFLLIEDIKDNFETSGKMPSVILTKEEHQTYTNAWRAEFPYGGKAGGIDSGAIMQFCRTEYANCGGGKWLELLSQWFE